MNATLLPPSSAKTLTCSHSVAAEPIIVPRLRRIAGLFATVPPSFWIVFDLLCACSAMAFAYLRVVPLAGDAASLAHHASMGVATTFFGISVALASHVFGLHDRTTSQTLPSLFTQTLLAMSVAVVAVVTLTSLVMFQEIGRNILALAFLGTAGSFVISRAFVWHFATRNPECIGLVGNRDFVNQATAFLTKSKRQLRLCPMVLDDREPHVVSLGSLADWAVLLHMDEIVFHGEVTEEVRKSLLRCLDNGLRVTSYTAHLEKNHECMAINELDGAWFLARDIRALHPHFMVLKRLMDIFVSALGLILSAPLMGIAVVLIKLESPGPAFYKQTRVGLQNRNFSIFKLRSMSLDAESGGPQWAQKNDRRVTRIGKLLRKTRMDEVPQFWNILKGEMSFIGPRPERPEFVESLAEIIPYYRQRHLVKPGLTGWAQINVDYGASASDAYEKLRYDLFYVKEASLQFDLHVCIRTIGAIMRGAR